MQSQIILHHHNVARLGGVPALIEDIVSAYPEFHHVVLHVFGTGVDYDLMARWQSRGIEVGHAPKITREIYDHWKPTITLLHNSRTEKLGSSVYKYFSHYPTAMWYHSVYSSGFNPGVTLFASRYTQSRIKGETKAPIGEEMIVHPVIDADPFAKIRRQYTQERCCIGKVSSVHTKAKFPLRMIPILKAVEKDAPHATFSIVGSDDFYKDTDGLHIESPAPRIDNVTGLYSDLDVFLYMTEPPYAETWGRILTEAMASGLPCVVEARGAFPEQIDHGINGFLCTTNEEFIDCTLKLANDPELRRRIGLNAKKKALEQFDLPSLRRNLNEAFIRIMGA